MLSKSILIASIVIVLFVHFTLLSNQKSEKKKIVIANQPSITKISLKKVVLKEKIEKKKSITKNEYKKVVKPVQKTLKKIVKESKNKVLKEKIVKKEAEKEIQKKFEEKEQKRVEASVARNVPKTLLEKKVVSSNSRNIIENRYLQKIRMVIEENKIYPKRAKRLKQEGKVLVSFVISKNGSIQDINLINESRFKRLNKAALELLEKISRFEPIPEELDKENWAIELPINYSIINS